MADPVTLAVIGMGATAAGGAVKAFGDLFTGSAQANADTYRSQLAMMNAKIAYQDAQYAMSSGYVESQQTDYKTADQIAHTKVGFASSNINPTTGSAGALISSERAIGKQNQAIVTANAAKRAYGYEVTSAEDMAQANIYQMAAKYDRTASYFAAGSTILGTVGKLSDQAIAGSKSGSGIYS